MRWQAVVGSLVGAAVAVENGLTDKVVWDPFSLSVLGQRIFLQGGEFHPWRLPSRSLWRDIIQKAVAGGMNSISIYSMPGMQNPSPGVLDFDGLRDLEHAFKEAKEAGLWVVPRPGPYVNAEVTGGGLPSWYMTQNGTMRTNDTAYTEAWRPYWSAYAKMIARNQVTEGGPVILTQIENEFDNGATRAAYMQLLQDVLRENGVIVPTTHNNKGLRAITYATGPGKVDIWGIDSYPGNGCSASWSEIVTTYNSFKNSSGALDLPLYSPEFVGGWFDPWGSTGNYTACRAKMGPEFNRLFYQSMWAQNARLINIYMYYGGTNWGGLAAPVVYTSYDYGAAIKENRVLTDKYNENKLMGLFLRSARDFRQTVFAPEVTNITSTDQIAVAVMKNYEADSTFYIARHNKSNLVATVPFTLNLTTSLGEFTVPQLGDSKIVMLPRDSRIVVADYKFGSTHVVYATPSILVSTTIDKVDWLVVYGNPIADQSYEIALKGVSSCSPSAGDFQISTQATEFGLVASFTVADRGRAQLTCGALKILALDTRIARTFWSPILPGSGPHGTTAEIGSNNTIIVSGPSLVRTAKKIGPLLFLTGDTNSTTTLSVYGLTEKFPIVAWNGLPVLARRDALGAWTGTIAGPTQAALSFTPPVLSDLPWKYHDSLPEITEGYDDSRWKVANKTSSFLAVPAYPRDGPVLLAEQDYGFPVGNVLFRGHFNATGTETGVYLGINGGQAFAASVWLNDAWLGNVISITSTDTDVKNGTFAFPQDALKAGEDNVVTVLKDNMGLNQNSGPGGLKQARGIIGYQILGGAPFSTWKIQGNLGGETGYPDKVRGVLNEGGLYAERAGWHLPGFSAASWETRTPFQGISKPGVGFFRTTFDLHVPAGHDVAMSFVFSGGNSTRVMLFVNGWQMGRYHANIGPQKVFPVHEGILNYHGRNTVAVSLWAVGNQPADFSISDLQLKVDNVVRGGVPVATNNPSWAQRDAY